VKAALRPADIEGMRGHLRDEAGFGLVELLIAMVVLQIALLALVGAFSAGSVALGRASHVSTAVELANQQMELYRSMPYDAIGLDTAGAPTTGAYVADTSVCPTGQSPVCGNTGSRNNLQPSTATWDCTAASGSTSVSTYFSANGVNPCVAHRVVSGASSPDGHTYAVDTYVLWTATTPTIRASKRVSVVVRDGSSTTQLAREVTTFDCSTSTPPGAPPCT
jgi:type II secretory pathway pseudopilin PulG